MRSPFFAEIAVDTATTRGTANPNAWGQAMTMTVTVLSKAKTKSCLAMPSQTNMVSPPTESAMIVSHKAARLARSWVLDLLS